MRRLATCLVLLLATFWPGAQPARAMVLDQGPYGPNTVLPTGAPGFRLPSFFTGGIEGPEVLMGVYPPCQPVDPCREPALTLLGGATPSIFSANDKLLWTALIGIAGIGTPLIPTDPCLPFAEAVSIGGGYSIRMDVTPGGFNTGPGACTATNVSTTAFGALAFEFAYPSDPEVTVVFTIYDESGAPLSFGPPIPEPATIALLGTALLGLGTTRRRRATG